MQIRNDWIVNPSMNNDVSASLKEGETVFVTIKEKLSNNEAIVTIKGQDMHVRFQGDIPDRDKMVVQITDVHQDMLEVQVVPQKKLVEGIEGSELAKIEQMLIKQGIRLTNEDKTVLKYFLEKAKGTMSEKLETIQALVNKKLPITDLHLQSIHEALHGEPFGEILTQLAETIHLTFHDEGSEGGNQSESNQQHVLHRSSEEPTFLQEKMDSRNIEEKIDSRNTEGKMDSPNTEESSVQLSTWLYGNEDWINGMPAQTKDVIVKTVTEKLSQVTIDFKKLQMEMNRKLENATFLLSSGQPQARQQGKHFIEAAIHTLDRAILRGEFMLFTDMGTEKQLLQASSKLTEAKQLLAAGKQNEALKIVNEVKGFIETLRFQPADVKVKHFVSELNGNQSTETPETQLASQIARVFKFPISEEVSARNTFEQFRQFGFQHEKDVSQAVLLKKSTIETENVKSLLMRLTQDGQGMIAQQAEQAVANITGQQLLSKFDTTSHMQTMFYQLPLLMQDKIETVNVYLNSRNDNGKLDWQNCSLYFLFDTQKYGKVGILLQSVERNLTVTIKADDPHLPEVLKPLTEMMKGSLETIGYNVKGIAFTKMSEQQEQKAVMEPAQTKEINSEKGYDMTV
jgi:hypothetical protein